MSERKDDEMQLISKVAEATGISVNTLRMWARTGRMPAKQEPTLGGYAWYTTVRDAIATKQSIKMGRPKKL